MTDVQREPDEPRMSNEEAARRIQQEPALGGRPDADEDDNSGTDDEAAPRGEG
jgi:hypothetical protein